MTYAGNVYLEEDLKLNIFERILALFSTKYELKNGPIRLLFKSFYFLRLFVKNLCILWVVWDVTSSLHIVNVHTLFELNHSLKCSSSWDVAFHCNSMHFFKTVLL